MKKSILAIGALSFMALACNQNSTDAGNSTQPDLEAMVDSHTSEISLDWDGVYEGVLPCADCEGIKTQIELKDDLTFVKNETYLGKKDGEFSEKGKIEWNKNGNDINLISTEGDTTTYKVKEGLISRLDSDGNEITGELASDYDLMKK